MRDAQNLIAHELIGLAVTVTRCREARFKGLRGKVLDEGRNTLLIRAKKDVRVQKDGSVFLFGLERETVEVEGWTLLARPEERTQKALRLLRRWKAPAAIRAARSTLG